MKNIKRSLFPALMLVIVVLMQVPVLAGKSVYNTSYKSRKRYVVTCNHHYDNKYNTVYKTDSVRDAKAFIGSEPAGTRGQWYVYDSRDEKIVWPDLSTNAKKLKKIVQWTVAVAKDPRHGYDCDGEKSSDNCSLKWKRWGKCGDYSCSTLVATPFELFGYCSFRSYASKHKLKIHYTGSSASESGYNASAVAACARGSGLFKDISAAYRAKGSSILKPGDILVNKRTDHTAIIVTKGRLAEGALNENNSEYGASRPGDQRNNREIRISRYSGMPGGVLYVFRPTA